MNKPKTIKDLQFTDGINKELNQDALNDIAYYEDLKLPDSIPKNTRSYAKGMVVDYIKHKHSIEVDFLQELKDLEDE